MSRGRRWSRAEGLELVVTLGTGVGTAFFYDGRLLPHLEFAHHPVPEGRHLQRADRRRGAQGRRQPALEQEGAQGHRHPAGPAFFDHCYVGGGNAKKIHGSLGDDVSMVDNTAGILGGIRLWDESHIGV